MKSTGKPRVLNAEAIARRADRGEDVSRYFTGKGKMMPPIQRVNVDFTLAMLAELDTAAQELNVSRQAVIKGFVRQALDHHYLAQKARGAEPRGGHREPKDRHASTPSSIHGKSHFSGPPSR